MIDIDGVCAVLDSSIEDCSIIIPTKAFRDVGTSYHYVESSDIIYLSDKYVDDFIEILRENNFDYIKGYTWTTYYVDDTLGEDGLLKLLNGVKNRKAYFIEVLAYCEYGKEPITFTSITNGTIAMEKSGDYGWSWDFIFIPDGFDKTLGNYPDEERFKLWNTDAYIKLANFLGQK